MDDSQLAFQAGMAAGRFDEFVRNFAKPGILQEWAIRRESLAIAGAESLASTEINLASLIVDAPGALMSRADRTAYDISAALRLTIGWGPEAPSDSEMHDLWTASERSNTRQATPDFVWGLEQDASSAAQEMRSLLQVASPWTAAEAVRRLWTRGRHFLDGKARRLAMVVSTHAIRVGFGMTAGYVGITAELMRNPDQVNEAVADPDAFFPLFMEAVSSSAARSYEAGLKIQRLALDLTSPFSEERVSSRTKDAVDEILMYPVVSTQHLETRLGITNKGASNILARLVAAQVVRPLDPDTKKNASYLCPKALNL